MKTTITLLALCVFALCSFAQTADPQPATDFSKPTCVLSGVAYNQFAGANGFASAIIPTGQGKMYASATVDLVPSKYTDAKGRAGYIVGASVRFGTHREMWSDSSGKTRLFLGADVGPSFAQSPGAGTVAVGGTNVGFASSFTLTPARMITEHIGIAIPIRALYMSGAGPGGAAAWNPVFEFAIIAKP